MTQVMQSSLTQQQIDHDGRAMQSKLDQPKLRMDMLNGAKFLKAHSASTGKVGATSFCWGGGTTNYLAETDPNINAGYPPYEAAAKLAWERTVAHFRKHLA